jgi:hypothetical protein
MQHCNLCSESVHWTLEDHLIHLQLELLDADHWKVKMSKCTYAQNQIAYLGHVVSAQGVATDPSKVIAIASCQFLTQ